MHPLHLRRHIAIGLLCLVLVASVGYGDYRAGYEDSLLLLYLIPIAIGTWYNGIIFGAIIAALSVGADVVSDRAASVVSVGVWNVVSSVLYYIVFLVLLSRSKHLLEDMHRRVEERTADLQREIVARKTLEQALVDVGEHERRRVGRDLHDSLCQHLTGTALTAQMLVAQLRDAPIDVTNNAKKVVRLVDGGIEIARDIARGLLASELESDGLIRALDLLAKTTSHEHQVECCFRHSASVAISSEKATQLYWIAREAVRNAIAHAHPARVAIGLSQVNGHIELCVDDNGIGISPSAAVHKNGIGLQVMRQRAELSGGRLSMQRRDGGGTTVRCALPVGLAS